MSPLGGPTVARSQPLRLEGLQPSDDTLSEETVHLCKKGRQWAEA